MKKEDKLELHKALASGLPHGLKVEYNGDLYDLYMLGVENAVTLKPFMSNLESHPIETVKPYLRPFSDLTDKEKKTIDEMTYGAGMVGRKKGVEWYSNAIHFLDKIHVDYRGLIKKGLAVEAPKDMYPKNTEDYGSDNNQKTVSDS